MLVHASSWQRTNHAEVAGDDGSVAASQFPRTRRPAHRGVLCLPARQACPVGVGLNSLVESAELLMSELVTNAVNATGQPGQTVSVNLAGTGTGARVLIEVWDGDAQPPGPREPGEAGPGDGVLLVPALSSRWDWYPT